MLTISQIDPSNKADVERFIRIPFRLYENHPQWVPPFISDVRIQLNKEKHPYYEHSVADFFIASRDGQDVGRIAALENIPFNKFHGTRQASFYLFECEDDDEAAQALFERVYDWARNRGLDTIVGPKGFSVLDGYGIQVEGHENRQMMNMMNYNYPYYQKLVEARGFTKEVDFVSCFFNTCDFHFPDKVHLAAERVIKRGSFEVREFKNKRDLLSWGWRIGQAYNQAFVKNWEYYPLTEREVQFLVDNVINFADHRLIKVVLREGNIVGFLFAFPDISEAMQRAKGKLNPITMIDLVREVKRTKWVSLNGAGILPEYQGLGGNLLLYSLMEKTIQDFKFNFADLTQVAETAANMRQDLINVGGKPYKNHRVYHNRIA